MNPSDMPNPVVLYVVSAVVVTGLVVWVILVLLRAQRAPAEPAPGEGAKVKLPSHPEISDTTERGP
jgi:hypothetical protein